MDSEFEQNPDPEYWLLLLDGDGVGVIHIFKYPLYPLCIVLYMEILWEFFFRFHKIQKCADAKTSTNRKFFYQVDEGGWKTKCKSWILNDVEQFKRWKFKWSGLIESHTNTTHMLFDHKIKIKQKSPHHTSIKNRNKKSYVVVCIQKKTWLFSGTRQSWTEQDVAGLK